MKSRELVLLDAAIEVLAEGGTRGLTHRAVDAQAGLPVGSTSNRFRTRDALLSGVLQRLLQRELALWTRFSAGMSTDSIEAFAFRLGRVVQALTGPERALTLARLAVFTQAALQSDLQAEIGTARGQLAEWMGPLLSELGSNDPGEHQGYLLALVDGLLSGQLIDPTPEFAPAPAIAALLHGLIDEQPS